MRLTNTSAVTYRHTDLAIHTNIILVCRLLSCSSLHGPRRLLDGPHEAARLGRLSGFSRLGVREAGLASMLTRASRAGGKMTCGTCCSPVRGGFRPDRAGAPGCWFVRGGTWVGIQSHGAEARERVSSCPRPEAALLIGPFPPLAEPDRRSAVPEWYIVYFLDL